MERQKGFRAFRADRRWTLSYTDLPAYFARSAGIRRWTSARIIDEAGVSRMTIYEYFPSKRASRCRSPDRPPSPFPSSRTV
ncbi:helix-turn-helix domain-containing protein [Burkholderia stagnalis]|uniref:helix-turn-helix domain-containing protein n=1 Tax=Burkholderia stagnalis TaxID=1503054 RepID=UPI0009BF540C